MMDRWDMMDGWGGAGEVWMIVGMIVIAVAVLVGIWLIVRSTYQTRASDPAPLDILRARVARGEITRDEFEAARRTLGA
jgi:uncharacterized membrane protein